LPEPLDTGPLDTDPLDPGSDVGLYVHWPYCARICPYCDFNVVRDRGRGEEQAGLVEAILADMRAQRALTGPRRLASIFFGGGTPSLMAPEAVDRIIDQARALFAPTGDIEVSLEANPTDAEAARFDALAGGRNQPAVDGGAGAGRRLPAVSGPRPFGGRGPARGRSGGAGLLTRLSIDLIYARPDQTPDDWAAELRRGARTWGSSTSRPIS
jgi:coproporphyrinogen III oxidase-like Fe-S oxidoreductase